MLMHENVNGDASARKRTVQKHQQRYFRNKEKRRKMLSIINAVEQRHKNGLTEKQRSFNNKKAKHWNIRRENYNSKKNPRKRHKGRIYSSRESSAKASKKGSCIVSPLKLGSE